MTETSPVANAQELEWDRFLESHPLGQFQQSAKWARVKAGEGWRVHRVGLAAEPGHHWGAQILWKKTRFGRIGYVSKGPVLVEENQALITVALKAICDTARQLGLRALIVQPPDESKISSAELVRHGFSSAPVPGVINATAVVDLEGGRAAIEARMNKKARHEAKNAQKRGVTIRFGTNADLPVFFALMLSSCRRQGVAPNPARLEVFEAMWNNFQSHIHVAFARVNGMDVAGLFMVGFGGRFTILKKGWDQTNPSVHANCLLNVEVLCWAATQGYRMVDFGGLDRSIAEALLVGRPLSPQQRCSRDIFHLRLGAQPKILPHAHVFVSNPVLSRLIGFSCRLPSLWSLFKAVARRQ